MRIKISFTIVFIVFIMAARAVFAESPREQLKQMVAQLQKSPNDNALREKIIKLAQELKPAPAVPEEARRLFVRGNTAMLEAKSQDDYSRAVKLYGDAIVIAPWYGDAYFNCAKAHELCEDFNGAISSLRFFILGSSSTEDKRVAQDQIYVLEEKSDKRASTMAANKRDEDERQKRERLAVEDLVGEWKRVGFEYTEGPLRGRPFATYRLEINQDNVIDFHIVRAFFYNEERQVETTKGMHMVAKVEKGKFSGKADFPAEGTCPAFTTNVWGEIAPDRRRLTIHTLGLYTINMYGECVRRDNAVDLEWTYEFIHR